MTPFPDKKYSIILADPPWEFSAWSDKAQKHVTSKYRTMSLSDIGNLPLDSISCDNAVLFLWSTFPNLPLALGTITNWGFVYKTVGFTWVKRNKKSDSLFWGMGYYTRSNAEVCLLAVKGTPLARISHSVHSVVSSPVREHSRKPDEVRGRIVRLFGALPRIELFARERVEGWDALGYDIDGMDISESIKKLIAPTQQQAN